MRTTCKKQELQRSTGQKAVCLRLGQAGLGSPPPCKGPAYLTPRLQQLRSKTIKCMPLSFSVFLLISETRERGRERWAWGLDPKWSQWVHWHLQAKNPTHSREPEGRAQVHQDLCPTLHDSRSLVALPCMNREVMRFSITLQSKQNPQLPSLPSPQHSPSSPGDKPLPT